ncbi:single-stranded-DNA-specific exonuclease RecJ [Staphylococcus felis]|uniref:Single-stranded-DNA-specific exonuclease RecJ n=2 Tax=Staphylococcus felis TaxID=46127 RepID=A0A3E0IMX0_9STAP|nr:single-stranded-DNA-specific exonuclease RecJ [Staphylococcus felis]REH76091.1 single-stranded-DNA-specific exonuclease RecJ [Staphylococcus felis]REH81702.1 single-stranded-DNA-specific exonuclease RecJ [Staphylococcus felis]REH92985.1 single-stranded-DNA-specific exonuclease RecJ [Staphylococcus felis]REH93986.1 single-stranded-DNA-specific exonuclease RecJ [Staphylococcus felis]REI15255.1 single-stranded-DNA-specific exonuclease RecJ [Staphylococcus felis]
MIQSKYQWLAKDNNNKIESSLIKEFNLTPMMSQVLESKGFTSRETIEAILSSNDMSHSPEALSDMTRATERIHKAIHKQESILVYGDYDADGVTSTSILVDALEQLGAHVNWYIPNRFSEGYGPSEGAFRNAYDEGVQLIITVDNGIQGHNEIDIANELGMDVIVTDHHEIGDTLPNAYAIIHPMHPNFDYPFQYLCGAGVALKLAQNLLKEIPSEYWIFAMIGTIADLVSMTDENRYIVKKGLSLINEKTPVSIQALLKQASFDEVITEETIGFLIGPRLNAVGRLEDAGLAVELLRTKEKDEALFLAEQVEYFNNERKNIVQAITEEAMTMAKTYIEKNHQFLVLAKEDWHEGVLGIVASRIVETFNLPTMILNIDHTQSHAKGSARSIAQISMYQALNNQTHCIEKFGGHHMAAGLTLSIENVDALRNGLNEWMKASYHSKDLKPVRHVDAVLDITDMTIDNIQSIERLRPFGSDFEKPTFRLNDLSINQVKSIGQKKNHLKLVFNEQSLQGLYWNNGTLAQELMVDQNVDLIGELQVNEWNGYQSPQIIMTDIQSKDRQILDYRNKNKKLPQFDRNVSYLIHPSEDKQNEHEYYYGEPIPNSYEKCVLRDLPLTIEDIQTSLKQLNASQVYLVFQHQYSVYFDGMPKPELFKKCYKALYQKGQTNLVEDGVKLSRYLDIKPNILKFILKVFLDLELIVQKDGLISIAATTEKRTIESSRIYQARLHRIEVEKTLLYQNFSMIKSWVEDQMVHEN